MAYNDLLKPGGFPITAFGETLRRMLPMRKKSLMLTSSLLIAVFLSTVAMATGGHGHKKAEKVGILLVAF